MILVTADLQLSPLVRDAYRFKFLEDTLPALTRKHRADACLILGDVCEDKDAHRAPLVNRVVNGLADLSKVAPVLILKGNHDYIDAESPFYGFLARIPGLAWVSLPTAGKNLPARLSEALGGALFLPHTYNYKRDWADLNFFGTKVIFAHQTFQGASVGPRKLEGIPLKTLPDVPIYSGDVHVPQSFDNVTYIGSPYRVDFGDEFNPRVLLLNEKWQFQTVPCPGPQKRLLQISSIKQLTAKQGRMFNAGDIVKVRVMLNATEHAQWPEIRKAVELWAEDYGLILHQAQPLIERQSIVPAAQRKTNTQTDEQLVKAYAQSQTISEATTRTGLELTRKV